LIESKGALQPLALVVAQRAQLRALRFSVLIYEIGVSQIWIIRSLRVVFLRVANPDNLKVGLPKK